MLLGGRRKPCMVYNSRHVSWFGPEATNAAQNTPCTIPYHIITVGQAVHDLYRHLSDVCSLGNDRSQMCRLLGEIKQNCSPRTHAHMQAAPLLKCRVSSFRYVVSSFPSVVSQAVCPPSLGGALNDFMLLEYRISSSKKKQKRFHTYNKAVQD